MPTHMLVFSLISITPGRAHAHSASPQMKTKHGEVEQLVREVTTTSSAQQESLLNCYVCFWPCGPNAAFFGPCKAAARLPRTAWFNLLAVQSSHRSRRDQTCPLVRSAPSSLRRLCVVTRFETNWPASKRELAVTGLA